MGIIVWSIIFFIPIFIACLIGFMIYKKLKGNTEGQVTNTD